MMYTLEIGEQHQDQMNLSLLSISDGKPMSKKKNRDYTPINNLILKYRETKDKEVLGQLMGMYGGFVHNLALKYVPHKGHVHFQDYVQEGWIGFMQGVDRYIPGKLNFTNYVSMWIRTAMTRYAIKNAKPAKFGTTARERGLYSSSFRRRQALVNQGKDPVKEFAKLYKMNEKDVELFLSFLDTPYVPIDYYTFAMEFDNEKDSFPLMDELTIMLDDFKVFLDKFRQMLTERELDIFENRILDKRMTLMQIGKKHKVTRERVRQLEDKLRGRLARRFSTYINVELPKEKEDASSNIH